MSPEQRLAEAATVCRALGVTVPELEPVVRDAGRTIVECQHVSGGWDYAYYRDSERGGDLSITVWQLQALHYRTCLATLILESGCRSLVADPR